MAAIGIAVIGAGMIGAAHAGGYTTYPPRFEGPSARLDTVCDANAELATGLAREWRFPCAVGDWRQSSTTLRSASFRSACPTSCIPRLLEPPRRQGSTSCARSLSRSAHPRREERSNGPEPRRANREPSSITVAYSENPTVCDEHRIERDVAVTEPVLNEPLQPECRQRRVNRPKNGSYIQRHMVATAIGAMMTGR